MDGTYRSAVLLASCSFQQVQHSMSANDRSAHFCFPDSAGALLRRATNSTDDPATLKGMLYYVAENLDDASHGIACVYCPMLRSLRAGPPCVGAP